MVIKKENKIVGFRRNANDNIPEISARREEKKGIDLWLLTEEQAKKAVSYYFRNKNIKAAEFAYDVSMVFETKSKDGIAGAEETARRFMVLAKILFRHYSHVNKNPWPNDKYYRYASKATWAEQKLLGFESVQLIKEARLREAEYLLRTKRNSMHNREDVKNTLRKFRMES